MNISSGITNRDRVWTYDGVEEYSQSIIGLFDISLYSAPIFCKQKRIWVKSENQNDILGENIASF